MSRADLRAHAAVANAIRLGNLQHPSTQVCVKCGETARYWHHHLGYEPEHWWDVQPMCAHCHRVLHAAEQPKSEAPPERLHLYLEPGTVEQIRGVAALRRRAISATARELLEERLAELAKAPA